MSHATPIVFVVDDDVSVRESLELLIRSAGWEPETFESAQEFLSRPRVIVPSCLVLDLSLPGLNGLEVQERVAVDRTHMPIIFITGYGDVPTTVQLQGRYASLSHRERKVMALVCHRFGASVSRSLAAPRGHQMLWVNVLTRPESGWAGLSCHFLGKGCEMLYSSGGRFELLAHVRGVLGVRGAHLDKFTRYASSEKRNFDRL